MGWRALPGFLARLVVAAAACLFFATRGAAEERGPAPFPPAALPDDARVEPSQGSEHLRPSADADLGPTKATPSLVEEPGRATMHAWFDLPHAFVERRIFDIANGFDQFFADERDLDFLRSSAFMSWRSEMKLAEDGTPAFGTTLRANFTFPYLQRRLRAFSLVLENAGRGLSDPEPNAISGRQDPTRGNALLRWTLLNTLRSSIDLNAGLYLKVPPGLVTRARYRFAHELGPVALLRVAATGFWNTFDGFGFNAAMSLERPLVRRGLLLRWTTGTLVSQVSHGYETGSEVALLANFSRTTAVTLMASGSTQSKPEPVMGTWRVASRLRAALFRRWLYGELEPEMTWPLDLDGHRHPVTAVIFRFEVQFEDEPPTRHP